MIWDVSDILKYLRLSIGSFSCPCNPGYTSFVAGVCDLLVTWKWWSFGAVADSNLLSSDHLIDNQCREVLTEWFTFTLISLHFHTFNNLTGGLFWLWRVWLLLKQRRVILWISYHGDRLSSLVLIFFKLSIIIFIIIIMITSAQTSLAGLLHHLPSSAQSVILATMIGPPILVGADAHPSGFKIVIHIF